MSLREARIWLGLIIFTQKHGIINLFCLAVVKHILTVVSFTFNRAIYFAAYSTAKEKLNGVLEPDSTQVHMVSAGMAGNYICEVTGGHSQSCKAF